MSARAGRVAGVTLIETLLAAAIAIGISIAAWAIFSRGAHLSESTSHLTELTTGSRNLLENLVRDVNAAHMVFTGSGDNTLVLIKYKTDSMDDRIKKNTSPAYPFVETQSATSYVETKQQMDALQVTYAYNASTRIVRRKEATVLFTAKSTPAAPSFLGDFSVSNASTIHDDQMAASVSAFELVYVAYDPAGNPYGEPKPIAVPGGPITQTACVGVHLKARFEEGLFKDEGNAPQIDILTKVWVHRRLRDEMYKEYFGSVDEDLRY